MTQLKNRQDKIKQKRMQTPWKKFVMEIASWQPLIFYRIDNLISRFPDTERIASIQRYEDYYEKNTDIYESGIDFDENKDFFEQFKYLWHQVKLPNMINFFGSENSEYADVVSKGKNIYLSTFVVNGDENVLYSFGVKDESVNIYSSSIVFDHSENVYMSSSIIQSFNVFYSRNIINSSDIWFSSNLIGCHSCLFCDGLENQSYCINNQEFDKETFKIMKKAYLKNPLKFDEMFENVSKNSVNLGSNNVEGNYLIESEELTNSLFTYRIHNGRNIINVGGFEGNEHIYDVVDGGGPSLSHLYGINGIAINSENCYVSCHVPNCNNVYYSYYLESCSNCIACIGLINKEYCIFNKEYSKDEWEQIADKIFSKMDTDGKLGDFFPGEINPFYFNDTIASLVEKFDKQEVIENGYLWRDEEIKVDIPEGSDVLKTNELDNYQGIDSEGNWTIKPEILKKVIVDEKGNLYRVVKMEYDFLLKNALPLSKKHWLDRIKLGFKFN